MLRSLPSLSHDRAQVPSVLQMLQRLQILVEWSPGSLSYGLVQFRSSVGEKKKELIGRISFQVILKMQQYSGSYLLHLQTR